MDAKLQQLIAFHLTGRRGASLQPLGTRLRPALFARFGDLTALRYDYPLLLAADATPEQSLVSLSRLVDAAVAALDNNPERDRIARHGYRLERELRCALSTGGGDFSKLWISAAARLSRDGESGVADSANRLWTAFLASGELVSVDRALPAKAITHLWRAAASLRARAFRARAERLLQKLRDILAAELVGSATGRTADRLQASVGSAFADSFDFDSMSRILTKSKPAVSLAPARRKRVEHLISVFETQRFYALGGNGHDTYSFAFTSCTEALKAYQARHAQAVELVKALAIAELETAGDYREATHDALFESFGSNGLDARQLALLPDYLVCLEAKSLDGAETARVVELLSAGVPMKVLVQTDDLLEPSAVDEGHVAIGLRARQLVHTAIGLSDVYVVQVAASHIFQMRDRLLSGLNHAGPALFSIFSGVGGRTADTPAYLVAAAAMESRVFPSLVYDPAAGDSWTSRLSVADNPACADDWPSHPFAYEEDHLQAQSEQLALTPADFMSLDERFESHFAIVPRTDWSNALTSVVAAVDALGDAIPTKVPTLTLVDAENRLQRAVVDDRILQESRRCRAMWRSLRELGTASKVPSPGTQLSPSVAPAVAVPASPPPTTKPAPTAKQPTSPPPPAATTNGDMPYIETPRCTSCNECVQRNSRMFAYNENKQAYIADPDAGTFRQLVEAAEGCQMSIIHPGKPRNPKEPGLEELLTRAASFA